MDTAPFKILHCTPTYAPAWNFGGPVLSVSQLCEGLVQLGHDVEVFTSDAGLKNHSDISTNCPTVRNGVKVTYFERIPGLGIHCPGMENAVRKRIKNFDLVHVTGVWQRTSYAICKTAQKYGIPYVVSLRGALGPYSWGQKTLKKAIYYLLREKSNVNNAAAVHYTALQELEECEWLRLPGEPVIVPNGLDTKLWCPAPPGAAKQWRAQNGIAPDELVFLNVGRLHHKKGLDLLPKALAPLRNKRWRMIFVGGDDDGTKDKLQKLFQTFDLTDHLSFLDACQPSELPVIYSASDLFILPSRHENFGNVIIEALACGCPVVISDKVGLHREISAASTGWVLPRKSPAWTNCLQKLLMHPEELEVKASRARSWVEAELSMRKAAFKMADCYSRIVAEKKHFDSDRQTTI